MKHTLLLCAVSASLGFMTVSAFAQTAEPAAPTSSVSPTETHAAPKPRDLQPPHDRKTSPKALEKYDVNKNGVLDPEEKEAMKKDRAAKREERLKKYDKNGDGKLDDTEREAMKADNKLEKKAK